MMGEAVNETQRSSSPLKRRASDLEESDVVLDQKEDVEMVTVLPSEELQDEKSLPDSSQTLPAGADEDKSPNASAEEDKPTTQTMKPCTDIPSIDYQIKTVSTLATAALEGQPQEGDESYLVSMLWLKRVTDRGTEARQHSKVEPEGEIGPVDNSDIIQQLITDAEGVQFAQLKPGMNRPEHFEMLPKDAWDMIVEWYGIMPGTVPIVRYAHNTSPDKYGLPNMQYELNPPIFTIHRLWGDQTPILLPQKLKAERPKPVVLVLSTSTRYVEFLEKIKFRTSIENSKKVRIWRVPRQLPAANTSAPIPNAATPPLSRPSSPNSENISSIRQPQDLWTNLLLDVTSFLHLEKGSQREVLEHEDVSANPKYNGNVTLSIVGLAEDQTIVIDEEVDAKSKTHVSNFVAGKHGASTALSRSGASQSAPVSGRSSPAQFGVITRGRSKNGRTLGTVGLSNLGNTCYMNSALQCVRSVEELTKYFLTGTATSELNVDNPLGNNGEVAMAYYRLLQEFYKDPVPTSVAPRQFKTTIGKYAPSFSGYGQQDSQEFLGFLLDGLQEDLSRVRKKPYIEKPDSTDEMIGNPQATREMAEKVWDITKKRDDSVIADLFTGMYQSTLVCPQCSKVSITFDPFNALTLQLPIESSWQFPVFYFPLNDPPVIINVDIDKQGTILNLKEFISKRVGVPVDRLFAAEEFSKKFYKIYEDGQVASEEVGNNDRPVVYELEAKVTNWPPVRKAKKQKHFQSVLSTMPDMEDEIPHWSDPMADSMLVPVFYRKPDPARNNKFNKNKWMATEAPHFIVVNPSEARDIEVIKRKILEKIATFSTSSAFANDDDEADASVSDGVDPDIVLTTGSDADSSGGSKVVATSVDGEDELVDVTMKDSIVTGKADGEKSQSADQEFLPLKAFTKRRPKFMSPGEYLNPQLQNMFVLNYITSPNTLICSGFNNIKDDNSYPTLASRIPLSQQNPVDGLDGSDGSSTRARSESSNEDNSVAFSNQTRMNEESSGSEDELAAAPAPVVSKALPVRSRAGVRVGHSKRRNRKMKTYSRKGNQHRASTDGANDDDGEVVDDGPLIRLGEGIIVDWNEEAWAAMYGGDDANDTMRGVDRYTNLPTLPDPQLDAKKKARAQRRKNGITLDDCLNEFGKEEVLSEADTWYCPRCKEHVRASKKLELWKTPDVLVIHLKRFSSSGTRRDKLDVMVDFPIEGLDISSRVFEKEDGKREIYDLIAVDDHWGGLGGGHYTAFAKSFIDGEWYEYNDSSVHKINDPNAVVTAAAYLLFYRRRSEVPLGGERFQKIFDDFENPHDPNDDDAMESGEEQRLVGNTFRGSSSALTGVEAAHRQPNHGSAHEMESLPPYQTHEDNDAELYDNDATMNDNHPIQDSIEDDEAIGMEEDGLNINNVKSYNQLKGIDSVMPATWNFNGLGNTRGKVIGDGASSDEMDDGRSDRGQCNSSASSGSRAGRLVEFENASPDESYIDENHVPDMDEEQQLGIMGLHEDLLARRGPEFNVNHSLDGEEVEEPATEIHVEEGEGLKMD
ncbi:hypothetical protein HYALB_00004990 [Hymenoscyphus albidus]|uniref:ubiquitinyl hydrolase 1 n=1 Tax=Hymenoscyphus albidus TaxID=595503 RepID=A0A9N9LW11_9HELO|nr:hypothetical protein HYALB_00004990 [Hymenoscyphus albidus]